MQSRIILEHTIQERSSTYNGFHVCFIVLSIFSKENVSLFFFLLFKVSPTSLGKILFSVVVHSVKQIGDHTGEQCIPLVVSLSIALFLPLLHTFLPYSVKKKNLGIPFTELQLKFLWPNFASFNQHILWSWDRALNTNWALSMPALKSIRASFVLVLALVHAQFLFCLEFLSYQPSSNFSSLSLWVFCGLSKASIWFSFVLLLPLVRICLYFLCSYQ